MKLCMIGVRGHNGYVFDGLSHTPARVVGVCAGIDGDDVAPLVTRCAEIGHEPKVYDDVSTMLDEQRPDLVSVAGPFERHAEICVAAFAAGAHVFCEKPVALTLEGLDRVAAARERAGVHFTAMMGLRYDPAFYSAWRAVREGAVGQVRIVHTQKSYRLGRRAAYYHHRDTYGGTIPWVGSHAIDLIHWFAARPFLSAYATHTSRDNHDHGELEVSALCHFTLADDIFASASIDYLRPAEAPSHGDDRIRVAGTEGVIEVSHGQVRLIGETGEQALPTACERQIFADFVAHAAGEGTALLDADDAIAVTRACLLARSSADNGRIETF